MKLPERTWLVIRWLHGSIYKVQVIYSPWRPSGEVVIWICSRRSAYAALLFIRNTFARKSRRNSNFFFYQADLRRIRSAVEIRRMTWRRWLVYQSVRALHRKLWRDMPPPSPCKR